MFVFSFINRWQISDRQDQNKTMRFNEKHIEDQKPVHGSST